VDGLDVGIGVLSILVFIVEVKVGFIEEDGEGDSETVTAGVVEGSMGLFTSVVLPGMIPVTPTIITAIKVVILVVMI